MKLLPLTLLVLIGTLTEYLEIFKKNVFLFSLSSVLFFFISSLFFNKDVRNKKIYLLIIPIYGLFDYTFSFYIGTAIFAFSLAELSFLKLKNFFFKNINFYSYTVYNIIFFLTLNVVNYFINDIFIVENFIFQNLLSIMIFYTYYKVFIEKQTNNELFLS